jgi:2-polyprenyl-6-methoxyphenol hydroxylase-like FAD-dependent oxidoreductase
MSACIALAKQGYAVDLLEMDDEWRALGAGITVLGSTLRALSHVDVIEPILDTGYFRTGNNVFRFDGTLIVKRPGMKMPDSDLPGSGGILRPALHRILADKVRAEGVSVRLGLTYNSIEQDERGVDVGFSDGSRQRYDLVIGADGLRSSLRALLFPDAPKPAFTGQGCWRLIADRPPEIDCSSFYVGGPVAVGNVPVSQTQMYVWVLEHVPDNPWIDPATQHHRLANLLKDFGGVPGRLREDLHGQSTIVYRPLEALLLPKPWYKGRIVLIGDAVHATTPHLASGAGIGIEDAIVLAQELRSASSLQQALEAHMDRRFERCRLIVESSLEIGRVEMAGQSSRINELMNVAQEAIARPF